MTPKKLEQDSELEEVFWGICESRIPMKLRRNNKGLL